MTVDATLHRPHRGARAKPLLRTPCPGRQYEREGSTVSSRAQRISLLLHRVDSPLGGMLLVTDARGVLRALDFADCEPRMRKLLRLHYGEVGLRDATAPAHLDVAFERYFARDVRALDAIACETNGTPFQRRVWAALREISLGTTSTYGGMARTLGAANAARAIGLANGANPIAIVVPCHRLIGADGALTGYAGGLRRKQWLLDHERARITGEISLDYFASGDGRSWK
jgi:O-6-methylguanine DNA methyltransferase